MKKLFCLILMLMLCFTAMAEQSTYLDTASDEVTYVNQLLVQNGATDTALYTSYSEAGEDLYVFSSNNSRNTIVMLGTGLKTTSAVITAGDTDSVLFAKMTVLSLLLLNGWVDDAVELADRLDTSAEEINAAMLSGETWIDGYTGSNDETVDLLVVSNDGGALFEIVLNIY